MDIMNNMQAFFERIYDVAGLVRHYRKVTDGLWIFKDKSWPTGIFIDKADWLNNKDFYKTYLFVVDDELEAVIIK